MIVLVVLVAYAVTAIVLFRRAPADGFFDTLDLRSLAHKSIASRAFWAGERPPGYPLLLKVIGAESPWVLRVQLGLHIVAWSLVAWGLARRCATPWVRACCFTAVVAGSLSPGLFGWTHAFLTESLSISLLLIPVGLVLSLPERGRSLRIACAVAASLSTLWWITVRDLNVIWLVIAALAAAALAFAVRADRKIRRMSLVAVGVSLLLATAIAASIGGGERWRLPMVNVIARRVLPVPARQRRWTEAGMPDNQKVRCFSGKWASDCNWNYSGFEPWLTYHARRTYAKELLREPAWLFLDPLLHWKELLCGNQTEISNGPLQAYFAAKPPLFQRAIARVFLSIWRWLRSELVVALLLVIWAWRRAGLGIDARTAPLVVLAATVYPTMIVVWHGDAMEMQRHALIAMVSLRIALWGALALATDALWRHYRKRSSANVAPRIDQIPSAV